MIGVLGDDISLDLTSAGDRDVSLNVKNGEISIDYVLSDLSVIPDPPALKRLPEFGTKIKLDTKFINTFVKGKAALSDIDTFTILNGKSFCFRQRCLTFNKGVDELCINLDFSSKGR